MNFPSRGSERGLWEAWVLSCHSGAVAGRIGTPLTSAVPFRSDSSFPPRGAFTSVSSSVLCTSVVYIHICWRQANLFNKDVECVDLSQRFSVFCGFMDPFKNMVKFGILFPEKCKEDTHSQSSYYFGGFYGLLKLSISMSLMVAAGLDNASGRNFVTQISQISWALEQKVIR